MSDCQTSKHSQNNIDSSLKLRGTIVFKGSFNSSTGYNATNFQSDSLSISAKIRVSGYKEENVDETCKFTTTISDSTVSGTICERKFSY
ncbi:MAG: hypothetical protein N3B13_00785 [Deltaproteobacteria bacterium]|nr:hypothetical protein [Deltaproteobacteria bacterium]